MPNRCRIVAPSLDLTGEAQTADFGCDSNLSARWRPRLRAATPALYKGVGRECARCRAAQARPSLRRGAGLENGLPRTRFPAGSRSSLRRVAAAGWWVACSPAQSSPGTGALILMLTPAVQVTAPALADHGQGLVQVTSPADHPAVTQRDRQARFRDSLRYGSEPTHTPKGAIMANTFYTPPRSQPSPRSSFPPT